MRLISKGLQVKGALAPPELAAQRRETRGIDSPGTQDETVRAFFQLQLIAGLYSQRLKHPGRERHLTFRCDFDQHT
jgi:hypothetical protein